jgi:hypothetical protein
MAGAGVFIDPSGANAEISGNFSDGHEALWLHDFSLGGHNQTLPDRISNVNTETIV